MPKKPGQFDKYIFSLIRRYYVISETQLLRKYPSFNPGALAGALSRLKHNQSIVMVPSLGGYMTARNYKERLTDGMADEQSIDDSDWHISAYDRN